MEVASWEERLKALPAKPGAYLFHDAEGNVLYVGKAASLHHRVLSYFSPASKLSPKLQLMTARVADFEFFVTDSEQEALLLECTLIKKYRPRYNVRLKDDKSYPYLKISLNEDFPRVYPTRRWEKDGSRYFGPFASSSSLRQTLNLLKQLFPFRSCSQSLPQAKARPCLEYHIHRCVGPCLETTSKEDYRQTIEQVILFLEGKQELVIQRLHREMEEAAENLDFEKATLLRDQIKAVAKVMERQKIASAEGEEDIIALARGRNQAYAEVFFIRNGKLLGREHFILEGTQGETAKQIMTSFVSQFYSSAPYIPSLILLQHRVDRMKVMEKWLKCKKGARVSLRLPATEIERELVEMVAENARQSWEQLQVKLLAEPETLEAALNELQQQLGLPQKPERIECYDISNIGGTSAVGSMVVFERGLPKRAHYRRFRIKSVAGINDYAMLQEVLQRRFRRSSTTEKGSSAEETWTTLPNLVLIDGGKGQLSAALETMQELETPPISVASIAKKDEEIFSPGASPPLILPRNSAALYLLQRIRDEAHRFALGYHHQLHQKKSLASALDTIPGIGVKRKKALLQKFGSVAGIKQASVEELATAPGMTRSVSAKVKEFLG